ncbi:hypothetical protein Pma05_81070 [Plantactinospora mayteni]|uniref:Aldehyde oxidase/xanthine dehydrogenase second molybdopterin binding domain-containing protein n=1 Tax=Plantactinospora mayteni TaxID=566021 RepID=A0ABQ4F3R0_9ACTN|nr:hypothetical protein Pma05_81070 [Plantactinospora mayteni]
MTSGSVTHANRIDTGPDPSGPYSIEICDGTSVAGKGLSAAAAWGWATNAVVERVSAIEMAAPHPMNLRLDRGTRTVQLSLAQ